VLALAACHALAVLALWRWTLWHRLADAALALLLAIACVTIKTPGIVWALTLVPALVVVLLPRYGGRIVALALAVALAVLLVLARTEPVVLGYRLHLEFAPEWTGLFDTFFLLGNWHLLWYAAIAAAALAWSELRAPRLLPLTIVIGVGMLFLGVVFTFTNARAWVTDQTTVNRATLHVAPLVVVWMVLIVDAWLRRATRAEAATAPEEPVLRPATPAP
jgi:hypothetical protein